MRFDKKKLIQTSEPLTQEALERCVNDASTGIGSPCREA